MAKDEMIAKQIAEINQHIRDGVNQWADTMLMADADQWAVHLTYYPRDIVNATMIFQHICSNVGIKAGHIDEKKAEEYGKRLRQLVIDMTGYDPAEIVSEEPHPDFNGLCTPFGSPVSRGTETQGKGKLTTNN